MKWKTIAFILAFRPMTKDNLSFFKYQCDALGQAKLTAHTNFDKFVIEVGVDT